MSVSRSELSYYTPTTQEIFYACNGSRKILQTLLKTKRVSIKHFHFRLSIYDHKKNKEFKRIQFQLT